MDFISRRDLVKGMGLGLVSLPLLGLRFPRDGKVPLTKPIPSSGEKLPVIGMGTSRTFDAAGQEDLHPQLTGVLQAFFDHGGTLIDSSPMYGSAEKMIGMLMGGVKKKGTYFAASKVWTDGAEEGEKQMGRSLEKMGVKVMDLMQIHNLRDWKVHLKTMRRWKEEGKIRYLGITTSHGRRREDLVDILKKENFDFVQFSYSIGDRSAEKNLLPLAQDRGLATLINRPFERGRLFRKIQEKELPAWAADFDCETWAQFFLKFIVSHPAVTCAIPATSKPKHMVDNMGALYGKLPDAATREKMIQVLES